MSKIVWDATGDHFFETGVSNGVLYIPDDTGAYVNGYGWNGLTKVTEKPTGASPTAMYADNRKYLNLLSTEMWAGTIEAYTYPDEFGQCDGVASPEAGLTIGQQPRKAFGFSWQTKVGNDSVGANLGIKIHLVYNALAAPSEKDYETVNDTPDAISFSWELSTTAIDVPGYEPTSTIVIDSTKVDPTAFASLQAFLYGTDADAPMLPTPAAVLALFADTITTVTPTTPTLASHVITIPSVTGVTYEIDGVPVTGTITITASVVVVAHPNDGYQFPPLIVPEWEFVYV